MESKPLITTGVDVTFDTNTTLKASAIFIAIAILFGVVAKIASNFIK
jgi:hypothetical protein